MSDDMSRRDFLHVTTGAAAFGTLGASFARPTDRATGDGSRQPSARAGSTSRCAGSS